MKKILALFYQFVLKYKKEFVSFLLVVVLAVIVHSLTPYFYKLFVEAISAGQFEGIGLVLLAFIGTRIVGGWLDSFSYYMGDRVLIPAARDARTRIFSYVQELDFAFHTNKSTGSLISAFKRGDGSFFDLFHQIHFGLFKTILGFVAMLIFIGQVSLATIGVLLVTFSLNSLVAWFMIKDNIKRRVAFNKEEDRVSAIITDNMINYETVKLFAQEENEEKRLAKAFVPWSQKIWAYANSFRRIDITIGTLSGAGIFGVIYMLTAQVKTGQIALGDIVMVLSFVTGFYYQFFDLVYRLRNMAKRYADIEKYFGLLGNEVLVKEPKKPVKVKNAQGEVWFKKIGFSYPDDLKTQILKGIDLKIEPGDTVAFVGRSGAGKTTLVKLLMRFYDVTKGSILIDGVDIRKISKKDLRRLVGVVPQEPILFNNTARFNLCYGAEKVTKKEMIAAAKTANIHDFLSSLPKGYETIVGERGIKLSGGQKQRLAIARMLLTNPKIIVFDEATSNLDSESEGLIQDALWKIAQDRTVILIAHRFSTLKKAQRIIVLEHGKIVEEGSHQELMEADEGLYQYLWQLQREGHLEENGF